MRQRITTWQAAAFHHALSYYGLAIAIAPFLLRKNLRITRMRAIQTWFETPNNNILRVTYKRGDAFNGRRIQVKVNNGMPYYFGPQDLTEIKSLLNPL